MTSTATLSLINTKVDLGPISIDTFEETFFIGDVNLKKFGLLFKALLVFTSLARAYPNGLTHREIEQSTGIKARVHGSGNSATMYVALLRPVLAKIGAASTVNISIETLPGSYRLIISPPPMGTSLFDETVDSNRPATIDDLYVDPVHNLCFWQKERIVTTKRENEILYALKSALPCFVSGKKLEVIAPGHGVHIKNLRIKLRNLSLKIESRRNHGFRLMITGPQSDTTSISS